MIVLNLLSLTEEFSKFQGEIDKKSIDERIASDYFKVAHNAKFEILAKKSFDYFEIQGQTHVLYKQLCGRCVKFLDRELNLSFKAIIRLESEKSFEDDVGIYYTSSEIFDLEEMILEQIILKLDPFWLPETKNLDGMVCCSACLKPVKFNQDNDNRSRLFTSDIRDQLKKRFSN
ncbi:MAG: DUF177 domain-containing protein [Deltaproteobacteria bacterium]|nr:DUF177 domain-containing protein [Deltaproteobacteria bacterium]